jgi:hypothetical protein
MGSDGEDGGSSSDDEITESGRVPKALKPFVQGTELLIETAKRLSAYEAGEMLYGVAIEQKALDKAAEVREAHKLEQERYVWEAVGYKDENQALKELQRCVNPLEAEFDITDSHGRTPVHVVSAKNFQEALQMLIDHDVDIHAADNWGRTPLFEACARGCEDTVELLMKDPDIDTNSPDDMDMTPLFVAVANKHSRVVKALLHNSATEVNIKDEFDGTPLHLAAQNGDVEAVQLLLRHKADVNAGTNYKQTAMHFACQNGYDECVELLLRYRADVNAQNKFKQTPLHIAMSLWTKSPEGEKDGAVVAVKEVEEEEGGGKGMWQV